MLKTICTLSSLRELMDSSSEISLYGAGYYLQVFLTGIKKINAGYINKIKCILVSDVENNPEKVEGIPVMSYHDTIITPPPYAY